MTSDAVEGSAVHRALLPISTFLADLRLLGGASHRSESAVNLPSLGAINTDDEKSGEPWDPHTGDLYLSSRYYESADGYTESSQPESNEDLDISLRFMDDLVDFVRQAQKKAELPAATNQLISQFLAQRFTIDSAAEKTTTD